MKTIIGILIVCIALTWASATTEDGCTAVIQLVAEIQRADYEGDRAALQRLYAELGPYAEDRQIASRVHYWQGFALWRRALNGFNYSAAPAELQQDLEQALVEFNRSSTEDPAFADARIAAGSCLSNLMYLNRGDRAKLEQLIPQAQRAMKEAHEIAPDNPRFYWVQGPNLWYAPPDRGGGQDKAIAAYEKGLTLVKAQPSSKPRPLDPAWGEAELLMNLAWSNFHRTQPDLKAAQTNAQAAAVLVPYWHYVKDILMPQIQAAVDTAAIQRLHDKDIAASKAGDFEALKSLFTEEAVVMPPGSGFVRGRTERDANMSTLRESMQHFEVMEYHGTFEEVRIFGNDAVEWGTISGKLKDRKTGSIEERSYKVMRMLSKQPDGEWKISRSMFNDTSSAPTAQ